MHCHSSHPYRGGRVVCVHESFDPHHYEGTPGELVTERIMQGLHDCCEAGVRVAYATDPTLTRYRVLA